MTLKIIVLVQITQFALQELHRLEKLQCIQTAGPNDYLVNMPLSVVYSNKWNLVVDASRHINPFVRKCTVKLDTLDDFAQLVQQNDFLAVNDLDSAYWHVPLHPSQYKFFGVSIFNSATGQTEYYQWQTCSRPSLGPGTPSLAPRLATTTRGCCSRGSSVR